jgi:tetratricopeptide (TPR) repeat protein
MSTPPDVLWVLDNETDGKTFERLCVDLLSRDGYTRIVPVGDTRDHGRDAEMGSYRGVSGTGALAFFQFSREEGWEAKLDEEAEKIVKYGHSISELVFVTPRKVTGEKRDKLKREFQKRYGWKLTIYEREWLRHRLEERSPDLAKKHLGVPIPQTPHHIEMILTSADLDDDSSEELFRHVTPTELKAVLLNKIKDNSSDSEAWRTLAKVEYHLRDYDAALRAVNEALRLTTSQHARLNLRLFKGGILAEHGIATNSRPLLVQAKEIFVEAAQRIGRGIDHYNLANVLGPLSDLNGAEKHYRLCLQKEHGYARAWKNLGILLGQKGEHEEEMKCYEKALQLKPDLVDAHLRMGTTLLRVFKKPEDAIRCFLKAYIITPNLDDKWSQARFWFSEALFAVGKFDAALKLIDVGLADKPDDVHLLHQKAKLLSKLWREDTKYEEAALAFFKFRAAAIPNDYGSLIELIELFAKKGTPDEAWAYLNSNLECAPYSLLDLKERAKLTLEDFKTGFRHAFLYRHFRKCINLEDHLATLHNHGLSPDRRMLGALNHLLMIPFGYTFGQMRAAKQDSDVLQAYETAWGFIGRIFPAFSVSWISKSKPPSREEQLKLLSIATVLVSGIALAEANRHVGFIGGTFGEKLDTSILKNSGGLERIYSDVGIPLAERALADWGLAPDSWRT